MVSQNDPIDDYVFELYIEPIFRREDWFTIINVITREEEQLKIQKIMKNGFTMLETKIENNERKIAENTRRIGNISPENWKKKN